MKKPNILQLVEDLESIHTQSFQIFDLRTQRAAYLKCLSLSLKIYKKLGLNKGLNTISTLHEIMNSTTSQEDELLFSTLFLNKALCGADSLIAALKEYHNDNYTATKEKFARIRIQLREFISNISFDISYYHEEVYERLRTLKMPYNIK